MIAAVRNGDVVDFRVLSGRRNPEAPLARAVQAVFPRQKTSTTSITSPAGAATAVPAAQSYSSVFHAPDGLTGCTSRDSKLACRLASIPKILMATQIGGKIKEITK